jgi:hypothetical protein
VTETAQNQAVEIEQEAAMEPRSQAGNDAQDGQDWALMDEELDATDTRCGVRGCPLIPYPCVLGATR